MDKEALQILNMFMNATQNAKLKNIEVNYHIERETLFQLFKKAFPLIQNETGLLNLFDMSISE